MRTIYCRTIDVDSLSTKSCLTIFKRNLRVRALCLKWYDGSVMDLLDSPQLVRRLVVRVLKELQGNKTPFGSYGGTAN